MYINLPSKNHYRRPASYASKGYRTRRMAVDFAVPLITNVKVAKLFFEALVRRYPLDVSPVDFKTSHQTHTFPGLVNIGAFVPGITSSNPEDLAEAAKASVSGGFATALVIPYDESDKLVDRATLDLVRANISRAPYCNYAVGITATANNVNLDEELQADVKALFIPFDRKGLDLSLSAIAAHFGAWPENKPIITNARGTDLAPILLFAGLHDRTVHVTDVQDKDDLLLISLSKAKQQKVTCDVSVYSLFFSTNEFPDSKCLPSIENQKALWQGLEHVDAFSVGSIPYLLAKELDRETSAWSGVEEALPLLLTAVTDGRLTFKDIQVRLHDNPIRILGLPEQVATHVEVVVGRRAHVGTNKNRGLKGWSPLEGKMLDGAVHRVMLHGQTAFLDGVLGSTPAGRDVSSAVIAHHPVERRGSVSGQQRPEFSPMASFSKLPEASAHQSLSAASVPPTIAAVYGPIQSPQTVSSLLPHPAFHRRHILSVKQFTHKDVHDLFTLAHEMQLQVERNGVLDILKGRVLCTVFYEPSTRTSSSFDAAMKRCGGEVVTVNVDSSSVLKGETLPDTIRTLGCYADAIVIRHPDVGSSQQAAKFSPIPVINAGDGVGEHPTQVFTTFSLNGLYLTL